MLTELSELDKAVAHCDRAIELNPDSVQAYSSLGNLYLRLGQLEKARDAFNRLSTLSSNSAFTRLGDAVILERQGRLQEAHDLLAEHVDADSSRMEERILLAIVKGQLGDDEEMAVAIELLESVSSSDDNQIRALFELGPVV